MPNEPMDRSRTRGESANPAREAFPAITLSDDARGAIEANNLAHLVTLNPDGSPQVSIVWVGLEGNEIVSGHLSETRQKLRNVRRDPRVALSFETEGRDEHALAHYLVVHGRARIEPGGAPELLQRLAHVYLGPGVKFPPTNNPPPGFILRITPERIGGVGPWQ